MRPKSLYYFKRPANKRSVKIGITHISYRLINSASRAQQTYNLSFHRQNGLLELNEISYSSVIRVIKKKIMYIKRAQLICLSFHLRPCFASLLPCRPVFHTNVFAHTRARVASLIRVSTYLMFLHIKFSLTSNPKHPEINYVLL